MPLALSDEVLVEAFKEAEKILPEGSKTPVELYFMMWCEDKLRIILDCGLCNTPKDLAVALKVYQERLNNKEK